jgi:hypothetical protein
VVVVAAVTLEEGIEETEAVEVEGEAVGEEEEVVDEVGWAVVREEEEGEVEVEEEGG